MAGRFLLFLPAYSPIYNPIELSYGFLKGKLKKMGVRVEEKQLLPAIAEALQEITPALVQGWFSKCNY